MTQELMDELLKKLKKSIGAGEAKTDEDEMYAENIETAYVMLNAEDISETILATDIGKYTTVLIAKALLRDQDPTTSSAINLLRNELSAKTKGERLGGTGAKC